MPFLSLPLPYHNTFLSPFYNNHSHMTKVCVKLPHLCKYSLCTIQVSTASCHGKCLTCPIGKADQGLCIYHHIPQIPICSHRGEIPNNLFQPKINQFASSTQRSLTLKGQRSFSVCLKPKTSKHLNLHVT